MPPARREPPARRARAKTIDNDLPLPAGMPTFGFQTARHVGTALVSNLMTDAMTTKRWYFVVAMGRSAGHLALGIAKAAGTTVAVIGEEFPEGEVRLSTSDILETTLLKRIAHGRPFGVAIVAEGLSLRFSPQDPLEARPTWSATSTATSAWPSAPALVLAEVAPSG